jgi:hypothetical protein
MSIEPMPGRRADERRAVLNREYEQKKRLAGGGEAND